MMEHSHIGIDVAKLWLDIHHPSRAPRRIDSSPSATRAFTRAVAKEGARVIVEASGGYDQGLREALEAAGARFRRVNPRQARDFARAMGVIGKTDKVGAGLLAEFGQRLRPHLSRRKGKSSWPRSPGNGSS